MHLNDHLSVPAVVHAAKLDWVASPTRGVDRRMLFRIGDEKVRATSIVRNAVGSGFRITAIPAARSSSSSKVPSRTKRGTFRRLLRPQPAGNGPCAGDSRRLHHLREAVAVPKR